MKNLNEQDFFGRVKSALENYEPDYKPGSWAKFSAILDRQGRPVTPSHWTSWLNGFVCGVVSVSLMIGIYLLLDKAEEVTISDTEFVDGYSQQLPDVHIPDTAFVSAIDHKTGNHSETAANIRPSSGKQNQQNQQSIQNIVRKVSSETSTCSDAVVLPESSPEEILSSIPENMQTSINPTSDLVDTRPDISNLPVVQNVNGIKSADQNKPDTCQLPLDDTETSRKRKGFTWDLFRIDLGLDNEDYKKFTGPDRVKLYYSPEIVFGSFQDRPGWSNNAGLMMEGMLNKRIIAGIGATFREYSWQKTMEFGTSTHDSATFPNRSNVDSVLLHTGCWRYFEIHVALGMVIISKPKWSIGANMAVSPQIMQYECYTITTITDNEIISHTNIPDKVNFAILGSFRFGLEYRYRLGERWGLYAEPYYRFQLNSVGISGIKPRYLGINAGVVYQFNLHRKRGQ